MKINKIENKNGAWKLFLIVCLECIPIILFSVFFCVAVPFPQSSIFNIFMVFLGLGTALGALAATWLCMKRAREHVEVSVVIAVVCLEYWLRSQNFPGWAVFSNINPISPYISLYVSEILRASLLAFIILYANGIIKIDTVLTMYLVKSLINFTVIGFEDKSPAYYHYYNIKDGSLAIGTLFYLFQLVPLAAIVLSREKFKKTKKNSASPER